MKKQHVWLVIIVSLVVGVIALLYPKPVTDPEALNNVLQDTLLKKGIDSSTDASQEAVPEIQARYPVPPIPAKSITDTREGADNDNQPTQTGVKLEEPLPALEKSDGLIIRALSQLLASYPLASLLREANIIPRIVVTVDNLPTKHISPSQYPTAPIASNFLADGVEGQQVLSTKNYPRYDIYINMLESVEQKKLVNMYFYFYPLFQQAYQDLGYQDRYFNDRLIDVIDDLLQSPIINSRIKLKRTSVMFKFVDPALELLSVGQKLMIRMGPENAVRVKQVLVSIRQLIITSETPITSSTPISSN